MKITPEQIELAKTATSAEQLQTMAKDAGIELDDQKAASLFARLHGEGELDDEAAGAVSGGGKLHDLITGSDYGDPFTPTSC